MKNSKKQTKKWTRKTKDKRNKKTQKKKQSKTKEKRERERVRKKVILATHLIFSNGFFFTCGLPVSSSMSPEHNPFTLLNSCYLLDAIFL